jgi:SAM-dependent methyltransferase
MGESDDQYVERGKQLANVARRYGLRETDRLLDIGSGYGSLAAGLIASDFQGTYVGVDILRKHVRWCRRALTPLADGRYRFRHLNVRNARYNPEGDVLAHEARLPVKGAAFDFCVLYSVFTHMFEADIRRYLTEIRRALKPGATALTTWFVFNEERLPAATDPGTSAFPMVSVINAGTRYYSALDPLHAISYDVSLVRSMAAEAGLEVVAVDLGTWCGDQSVGSQDIVSDQFQDTVMLRRPTHGQRDSTSGIVRAMRRRLAKVARRVRS